MTDRKKVYALVSGLPPFLNELSRDDFRSLICFLVGEYSSSNNIEIFDLLCEMITTITRANKPE